MPGACVSNGLCHILLSQGQIGVHMGKGAQGTWCVTHGACCTLVAVTCDEVDKVEIKCIRVV